MIPRRGGMTLLELLIAISLCGIVAAAVGFWIISQARAQRAARGRLATATLAVSLKRLLDDDLVLAVPDSRGHRYALVDDHTLALTTLDRLPGEPVGFQEVTWRFDPATQRLLRSVAGNGQPRALTDGGAAIAFVAGDEGRLLLRLSDDQGGMVQLPVWSEGR